MGLFRVVNVIDGDAFDVDPRWNWNGLVGMRVRVAGYHAELHQFGGMAARSKLASLVLGRTVELRKAYRVDRGRLVSDVFFNGYNLASYFGEYQ